MAQVVIKDVEKTYPNGFQAVKGINLHVKDEEFCVLVGPSGCGKSTTLRMVAGLEEITGGTVHIGQRLVNDVSPKDRDIAMVFQNYALYPHMSVYKNMAFGLKLRNFKKADIDERVNHAADVLGIRQLLDRKPKQLSGGQRQRVAVGRAIVRDPACFLFDEPLSNLDAKLRVETRAELKRLHRQLKTTTIYVTHDQEEAMTLGDRVVVMSEGLIQQAASPLETYNRPFNRFVAGFLGTPPMNFLDGKIVEENGALYFVADDIKILLDGDHAEVSKPFVGQDMVFGIRPEGLYLRLNEFANNEAQSMEWKVDVIEPLGATMDVYMSKPDQPRIIARVKAQPLQEQANHKLFIDMEKAHIFEPGEYGRNITIPEAPATEELAPTGAA